MSLKIKKIETYITRKMEIRRNSSKEIAEMSNKESVTKGGRAVAILKQGTMRERCDMKGMERKSVGEASKERERQ